MPYTEFKEMYFGLINRFDPRQFDPAPWARAAREAGMRYVVFTTKHHDGFSMWDTKQTDFSITGPESPFRTHPRANVAREIFDAFRAQGGGRLSWWVDQPDDTVRELAAGLGLHPARALHEMRRPLPMERHAEVVTRSFVVGQDDDAWLAVNNRAFASHGEQGGWTPATLASRIEADRFQVHSPVPRLGIRARLAGRPCPPSKPRWRKRWDSSAWTDPRYRS